MAAAANQKRMLEGSMKSDYVSWPFYAMKAGETKDYTEADPLKMALLVKRLGMAKRRFKERQNIVVEYAAVSSDTIRVTVVENPNPRPRYEVAKPKPKKPKTNAGVRASSVNIERKLWRDAFLKAFDVVPVAAGDNFHLRCARHADSALDQYRQFVKRHELSPPDADTETEEGDNE